MLKMTIVNKRPIQRTLLSCGFLLLFILGLVIGGLGGIVGVLAGGAVFVLNRRMLLHCIEIGDLQNLPLRIRRNSVLRMVTIFGVLVLTVSAVPTALGWAIGTWLLGQALWLIVLVGSLRGKGDEQLGRN